MKTILIAVGVFSVIASAAAADRCSCIANGRRIAEGKTACIQPRSGDAFLARCEIVLNNTSWRKLQDGCPSASARGHQTPFPSHTRPS